jgi:hypothetical protein
MSKHSNVSAVELLDKVYIADIEYIKAMFVAELSVAPKTWKCPCAEPACLAAVVYARGHDERFYFMSTQTFQPKPPYPMIAIDNVEDFGPFLDSGILPEGDMHVYAVWLANGLKEAIISA